MKARGVGVDLLPALGEARLQAHVLTEPHQRIEDKMRELQGGACQLLVRIERGGVGVIGHAQGLGRRRHCEAGEQRESGAEAKPGRHAAKAWWKGTRSLYCPGHNRTVQSRRRLLPAPWMAFPCKSFSSPEPIPMSARPWSRLGSCPISMFAIGSRCRPDPSPKPTRLPCGGAAGGRRV